MDWAYDAAPPPGNVVQTARLPLTGTGRKRRATLSLGFGADPAGGRRDRRRRARRRLRRAPPTATPRAGTTTSAASRGRAASRAASALYDVSLMVMAALEDKTYRGAGIAVAVDGLGLGHDPRLLRALPPRLVARPLPGGLRRRSPRATARAGERALDYLWERQMQPDGCFPQNSNLDGTPHWPNLQLDEVADPILLAWQLGRADARTWSFVRRAAGCILDARPDLAGALGERGGLLARHDRRRGRRARRRRRHRAAQRRLRRRRALPRGRRRVAEGRRGLDAHAQRPAAAATRTTCG